MSFWIDIAYEENDVIYDGSARIPTDMSVFEAEKLITKSWADLSDDAENLESAWQYTQNNPPEKYEHTEEEYNE